MSRSYHPRHGGYPQHSTYSTMNPRAQLGIPRDTQAGWSNQDARASYNARPGPISRLQRTQDNSQGLHGNRNKNARLFTEGHLHWAPPTRQHRLGAQPATQFHQLHAENAAPEARNGFYTYENPVWQHQGEQLHNSEGPPLEGEQRYHQRNSRPPSGLQPPSTGHLRPEGTRARETRDGPDSAAGTGIHNEPELPQVNGSQSLHQPEDKGEQYGVYYSKEDTFKVPSVAIPAAYTNSEDLPPWVQAMEQTAQNSSNNWDKRPHISIDLELQPAADYTQYLLDHALICYFTSQCPRLDEFSSWVKNEFTGNYGWDITHVKFVGKNFYMILFDAPEHRQAALNAHPWFYQRKFMYVFAWDPDFDVSTGKYSKLPVWVEIPYRSLILEPYRMQLAKALGPVLLYLQGEEHSTFPHDRACILWDLNKEVPHSIEVRFSGISIWQPVTFKNLPFTCFKCNATGHIARECPVLIEQQEVDGPRTNLGIDSLHKESVYPVFTVPNQQNQPRNENPTEAQQRTGQNGQSAHQPVGASSPNELPVESSREEGHRSLQQEKLPSMQQTASEGEGIQIHKSGTHSEAPRTTHSPPLNHEPTSQHRRPPSQPAIAQPGQDQLNFITPPHGTSQRGQKGDALVFTRGERTPPNQHSLVPSTTTTTEEVEMADFSEHDLIMIQRWQRMHGTNQRKQGGLTPSKDKGSKASPLNNKKKKSSGALFPSPKDANFTHSLHRELEQDVQNEWSKVRPKGATDTDMDDEQGTNEAAPVEGQHSHQEETRQPDSTEEDYN
jgi:hypothetical protein